MQSTKTKEIEIAKGIYFTDYRENLEKPASGLCEFYTKSK